MKAKKGYKNDKPKTETGRWLKWYFEKRTVRHKKIDTTYLENEKLMDTIELMIYEYLRTHADSKELAINVYEIKKALNLINIPFQEFVRVSKLRRVSIENGEMWMEKL